MIDTFLHALATVLGLGTGVGVLVGALAIVNRVIERRPRPSLYKRTVGARKEAE
jgi:hypothetical protein